MPVSQSKTSKTSFVCKVFFKDKSNRLNYVGQAEAPKSLFNLGGITQAAQGRSRWTEPRRFGYTLATETDGDTRETH